MRLIEELVIVKEADVPVYDGRIWNFMLSGLSQKQSKLISLFERAETSEKGNFK